jgi:hypothetical protein
MEFAIFGAENVKQMSRGQYSGGQLNRNVLKWQKI